MNIFNGNIETIAQQPISNSSTQYSIPQIVIILDESDSMTCCKDEVIQGINKFIIEQQAITGFASMSLEGSSSIDDCNFTLIKFGTKVKPLIYAKRLSDVPLMTDDDFKPGGMTALYDAIGFAFGQFANFNNVILVIVTDGEENASKNFNRTQIKELIDKYKNQQTWAWNIIYLASDPFLSSQGTQIGLYNNSSSGSSNVNVPFSRVGDFVSGPLSDAVSGYRSGTNKTVSLP